TINSNIIAAKGRAVINVIVWRAFRPPALRSNNANTASRTPHHTTCHLGDFAAFLVAILFITNIPESADVTKKMTMIAITNPLVIEDKGMYSRNRNISASGSDAN